MKYSVGANKGGLSSSFDKDIDAFGSGSADDPFKNKKIR
jgi:hypothetical protein